MAEAAIESDREGFFLSFFGLFWLSLAIVRSSRCSYIVLLFALIYIIDIRTIFTHYRLYSSYKADCGPDSTAVADFKSFLSF